VSRRLVEQLTDCVSWPGALEGLRGYDVEVVVELGPKTVLGDLTRAAWPDAVVLSCGDPDTVAATSRFLTSWARRAPGARVSRRSAERFLTGCLRLAVGTPSPRRCTPEEFALQVRAPYQQLVGALDELRTGPASRAETVGAGVVAEAARHVLAVLAAKGLDESLRRELVDGLAGATRTREEVMACLLRGTEVSFTTASSAAG
jgi:hypothetical protein